MMVAFLREWITNITVIIVFVMLMETVMPNNSMKRYINVIIGLLIIIVVSKPFISLKQYAEGFSSEYESAASYIEDSSIYEKGYSISHYQTIKALEIYERNVKKKILQIVDYLTPGNN